eukprot:scaffold14129_cov92-Amphora_coffeaeformis.AAC.1
MMMMNRQASSFHSFLFRGLVVGLMLTRSFGFVIPSQRVSTTSLLLFQTQNGFASTVEKPTPTELETSQAEKVSAG